MSSTAKSHESSCWNCRRLGNPQIIQELGDLIRAQGPVVVFVAETWLVEARLKFFFEEFKFWEYACCFQGKSGRGVGALMEDGCST